MTEKLSKEALRVRFVNEPIQWHLNTTSHDRCPKCGSGLGYLGMRTRMCMGTACDSTWKLTVTPKTWAAERLAAGAPTVPLRRGRRPTRA